MEPVSIDIARTSDVYARAKIDAELILNLCAGISQITAENKYLKEKVSILEGKTTDTPKKETAKGA
jgi:hypothetical protein